MSNTARTISIVIWSLVILALVGVLVLYFTTDIFSWKRNPHTVYETTLDGSTVANLEVKWRAGRVHITPSADNTVFIKQTSAYDVEPLEVSQQGNSLRLEERKSYGFFFFGFGTLSSELELRLPQKQYDTLLLQITSGKAEMSDIQAQGITLRMTSGSMDVSSLQAETLDIGTTSGSFAATGCVADTLRLESTSGTVRLSEGEFAHIEAESTSGTVRIQSLAVPDSFEGNLTSGKMVLTIPENDGFTLGWEKGSGNIRAAGFGLDGYTDSRKGKVTYGSNTSREYRVEITSGTFQLEKGE